MVLWWGTIGAAIATVVVVFFITVPYNLTVILNSARCRLADLFDFRRLTKTALITVPPSFFSYLFLDKNALSDMMISIVIFLIYYAIVYASDIKTVASKYIAK